MSLVNPTAGIYTIVIDGWAVPAGTTAYDYRDQFYWSGLGNVSASGSLIPLPKNGATATISGFGDRPDRTDRRSAALR